ncbi:hypothetical protein LPTSP4_20040 [Leptospira ryugenii]|uniref:Copper chaperone PCu(A)C n=1 Tax=Leptospira ryugenii TaxID=1917863 RepID=A0A2P2E0T1_9LEPT|nr:hypothetical protein LPTSP4_20040 [Leptospira ryugenii]
MLFQVILSFSCTKIQLNPENQTNAFQVRSVPEGVTLSVAYGTWAPKVKAEAKLVGIHIQDFQLVEWHESQIDERAVMRMKKVNLPLSIPPGSVFTFSPSGTHLMLLGRKRNIQKGDRLPLSFVFETGESESYEAIVE